MNLYIPVTPGSILFGCAVMSWVWWFRKSGKATDSYGYDPTPLFYLIVPVSVSMLLVGYFAALLFIFEVQ